MMKLSPNTVETLQLSFIGLAIILFASISLAPGPEDDAQLVQHSATQQPGLEFTQIEQPDQAGPLSPVQRNADETGSVSSLQREMEVRP